MEFFRIDLNIPPLLPPRSKWSLSYLNNHCMPFTTSVNSASARESRWKKAQRRAGDIQSKYKAGLQGQQSLTPMNVVSSDSASDADPTPEKLPSLPTVSPYCRSSRLRARARSRMQAAGSSATRRCGSIQQASSSTDVKAAGSRAPRRSARIRARRQRQSLEQCTSSAAVQRQRLHHPPPRGSFSQR